MSGNMGKKLCQQVRDQKVPVSIASLDIVLSCAEAVQLRLHQAVLRGRKKLRIQSKMFSNNLSSILSRFSLVCTFSCMYPGPFSPFPMLSQGSWQTCSGSSSLFYGFDMDAWKVHTEGFINAVKFHNHMKLVINWKQLTEFALRSSMDKL